MTTKPNLTILIFTIAALSFLLSSCEHFLDNEYWVTNTSQQRVFGYSVSETADTAVLFVISNGQQLKLTEKTTLTGRKTKPCELKIPITDVLGCNFFLIRKESDSVYTDYSEINNWTCSKDRFDLSIQ